MLAAAGVAGCDRGLDVEPIDEADAGGIGIEARHEAVDDSLQIVLEITNNTDTSADITLNGGCSITVIVREDGDVVWDEREVDDCTDPDRTLPLAPHEYERLRHRVALADIDGGVSADAEILTRVLIAQDSEYILRTTSN